MGWNWNDAIGGGIDGLFSAGPYGGLAGLAVGGWSEDFDKGITGDSNSGFTGNLLGFRTGGAGSKLMNSFDTNNGGYGGNQGTGANTPAWGTSDGFSWGSLFGNGVNALGSYAGARYGGGMGGSGGAGDSGGIGSLLSMFGSQGGSGSSGSSGSVPWMDIISGATQMMGQGQSQSVQTTTPPSYQWSAQDTNQRAQQDYYTKSMTEELARRKRLKEQSNQQFITRLQDSYSTPYNPESKSIGMPSGSQYY